MTPLTADSIYDLSPVVAFTGHRPDKLGGYDEPAHWRDPILYATAEHLAAIKPVLAISGMALGYDQWAARLCVSMNIPFVAALPFVGQERRWAEHNRKEWTALCAEAAATWVVGGDSRARWHEQQAAAIALNQRNRWMMARATHVIACFDGTPGGTANALSYARRATKAEILVISPQHVVRDSPRP